jgi:hypothetical protein
MTHSTLIARLMGPVLLVMGIGMALGLWLSPDVYTGVMKDFMGNIALIWLVGILALVTGLAIVNVHNMWVGDWRVIITILGWLAILRGVVSLLFPAKIQAIGNRMVESNAGCVLGALALVVLGAILTAKGYEEMWAEKRRRPAAARSSTAAPRGAKRPRRR